MASSGQNASGQDQVRRQSEDIRRQDDVMRQDEVSRRQDDVMRQDEVSRRQDDVMRQDEDSRRQDDVMRQDEDSRRQDDVMRQDDSRRQDDIMRQDEESRRQDEESRRQDEDNRRQDEDNRRQDEDNRKQDEDNERQDEDTKNQDEDNERQDEDTKKQDEDNKRQGDDNRRQDEDNRRQDEDNRRQDEVNRRQDEDNRRQDEDNRRQDAATRQDEDNERQDEDNKRQDEDNRRQDEVRRQDGVTLSQQAVCIPVSHAQGKSDLMIDMDDQQYVETPTLFEADTILQDIGCVILCGPPGCGKTTLGRALLRRCRHQGFKPYTMRQIDEWDSHIGENRYSVVLLDGTLGEVQVDSQQHAYWKQILDTALTLIRKGTLRLVITAYPHVLRELRLLEKSFNSPLDDDNATVYLTDTLSDSVKEKMLMFHLKKVRIEADRQQEIVQNILQNDGSGSVFPWCYDHMVNHWNDLDDPTAIFSVPAEAHSRLLKEMVLHRPHGSLFAAVFALTMGGLSNFLNHPSKTDRHLQELGFQKLCSDDVAGCAHILQGSMLSAGQFASRVVYEAAGLALGRFFRLPVLLKVCDAPFLVQYVDMTAAGCVTVGSVPSCSQNTEQCTLDRQSLVERIYTETVQGNLQYICQQPCLHRPEFLQELDNYCAKDRMRTKLLLDAVDSVHKLPLLYWSAFHPSTHLTHWCLSKVQPDKHLATAVMLAHLLFDHIAQNSGSKRLSFFHSQLTPELFEHSECTMNFPFVEKGQPVTKEMKKYSENITGTGSVQERLLYLSEASLPIPTDVVTAQVSGDILQLQVKDRGHWYLVFRLLTDRDVNQTDRDGDPLLHTAVISGEPAVVRLCLEAGAVITQRNKQGFTPYQLAYTTRSLVPKSGNVKSSYQCFTHISDGNKVEEQLRLLQELNMNDKDKFGRTGLLTACEQGQGDIADLYIELGADVDAQDRINSTPLQYACRYGLVHTVVLLLLSQANVAPAEVTGETALHFACSCRSHTDAADITRRLVELGADVNAQNMFYEAPLLWAAARGHSDAAELLLRHGAAINTQNEIGDTALTCAAYFGYSDTAELLIRHGADINIQNTEGNSALLNVARNGDSDTAELLIRLGADIEAKDRWGESPLMSAMRNGRSDTAELLIGLGADINTQNMWGVSPLLLAVRCHNSKTAELLICHGAETYTRNKEGDSPLLCAVRNGDFDTAEQLICQVSEANTGSRR